MTTQISGGFFSFYFKFALNMRRSRGACNNNLIIITNELLL